MSYFAGVAHVVLQQQHHVATWNVKIPVHCIQAQIVDQQVLYVRVRIELNWHKPTEA